MLTAGPPLTAVAEDVFLRAVNEREHEPPVYEYPSFVVNSLLLQQLVSQTNTLLRSGEEQKDDELWMFRR
jgi:hypothetical protein